jgi:hypothetical protein
MEEKKTHLKKGADDGIESATTRCCSYIWAHFSSLYVVIVWMSGNESSTMQQAVMSKRMVIVVSSRHQHRRHSFGVDTPEHFLCVSRVAGCHTPLGGELSLATPPCMPCCISTRS